MPKLLVLLLTIILLATPVRAQTANDITYHRYDNGLEVLVWPDKDIPNVAFYNFVRVGGRNEVPGITGLSHFFEHMMFNGTANLNPGEFDRVMEAAGGSNNAYTSNDLTVYQDWFPSSALNVILDLEADRLANLAFVQDVVDSERQVVYSERRSGVDNDNTGLLFEQLLANAFIAHPYSNPVIGWPSDVEAWTLEDLKKFYQTYYAPNNSTIVVVGDVDADQLISEIGQRMGAIEPKTLPSKVRTKEPTQLGERRFHVDRDVASPMIQIAYKTPEASHEDGPALDLLLDILSDGDSSRLYRAMVEEQQSVINIGVFRLSGFDPGVSIFYMTLPQGGDLANTEAGFNAELNRIINHGVTDKELQKVKNSTEASFWSLMSTINGKANALGTYHVLHGGYKELFDAPNRYAEVTKEQVRDVAARYFLKSQRTVGTLSSGDANGELKP